VKGRGRVVVWFAAIALAGFAWAGAASGETLFAAMLDGANNHPPTGSGGTGTATLILNDEETEVSYVVTYEGLEGAELDCHFHQGGPGEDGIILHHLPLGTPKFGVWEVSLHDVGDLYSDNVYINIHTTAYPSGEIRGNISQATASAEEERLADSWGQIKALFR